MAEDNESLLGLVNASGFLFQIRVEDLIKKNTKNRYDEWQIAAHEFRWIDFQGGLERFIDIVLEKMFLRLVIECKRVNEGHWIFLFNKESGSARFLWTDKMADMDTLSSYDEFLIDIKTPETSFCVVRGQSDKDSPMLERIAGVLLRATEYLADEELKYNSTSRPYRVYCPVIITNASLDICRFDPSKIDISTGQLSLADSTFETVPYIQFRKGLSSSGLYNKIPTNFQTANQDQERSIFIVNSNHLLDFLREFTIKKPWDSGWPWSIARGIEN